MKTVEKIAVNPDTRQSYLLTMPGPQLVRQAILELEYPPDGIKVVVAIQELTEKFQLSDEQKHAKNMSNLNVFRYDVVAPQFKWLLREGKLVQPEGSKAPYFPAESSSGSSGTEFREDSREYEGPSAVETVDRTAANPKTGEEYQIKLPATRVVKEALLDFDYTAGGIEIRNIVEALADQFGLSNEQRHARGKYGLVWRRHVNIAANGLVNSGDLSRIKRGWIINPEQPDVENSDLDGDSPFSDGETPSPEAIIVQKYQEHQDRLKEELLQNIMDNPPDFFEKLVLDLLLKMGYCDSRADAEAVGRSGDGGIDGIINQDPLGLDVIYIQAKRWRKGNVGSPDIQRFIGALTNTGALKGVFITTSSFTENAEAAANESAGPKIVLIDGKQLVQLMFDHNLGISLGSLYQLKEVDVAYFTIDGAGGDD
ncbi:hypothetical protein F4X10_06455 [Candidatus Poribacteria bacterium]|nr:hypothetical protein [Candidatus Poribacteria bacterium]